MHLSKKFVLSLFFIIILSCGSEADQKNNLTVAVASSLVPPLEQVVTQFEKEYPVKVDLVAASSGVLATQIIHGAPFDLYISANLRYPHKLHQAGVTSFSTQVLTCGVMVFWSKKPLKNKSAKALLTLQSPAKIAIANPELAPFGHVAVTWLKKTGLYQKVQPKLVYGENIGQVNQFILSGSVDAAFTSTSARYVPQLQGHGYWKILAGSEPTDIAHGVLLLEQPHTTQSRLLQTGRFLNYLLSPKGQATFNEFGYSNSQEVH